MSPEQSLPDKERQPVPARFIGVTLKVEKDGNSYLSTCPELDTFSYGDTIEEATQNIAITSLATIALHREDRHEDKFLSEKGVPVQTVGLHEKSYGMVIGNADQKGHFRLFIDAGEPPTGRELREAVNNLS